MEKYNYDEAFCRNRGFISLKEQTKLSNTRVAIAGLGGTGGAQIAALSRLGIGKFHLADLDEYELKNFNRQFGATMSTIGKRKTDVAKDIILNINPTAIITCFESGINEKNINEFLTDVDIVIDSLDFYCFKERFLLYAAARKKGIWVLTAPPLGFGFSLLCFDPNGMSFEDYFGFNPLDDEFELSVSFIVGIAPRHYTLKYLDRESFKVGEHKLPSVSPGPFIIAGVITTHAFNILIKKVPQISVPTVIQYDALLNKYKKHHFIWGMKSPLQRLKKIIVRKMLAK